MPDYVPIELITSDPLDFTEEVMRPIRESIEQQGLHHPLLVVEETWDGNDEPHTAYYKLIAGKKRLLALKQLGTKEAPVKIYPSNLTQNQLFEITLHENLRRWNLPWHEQVELELKLHTLKLEMAGKPKHGGSRYRGKSDWTQADTARELGIAVGALSEDLDLARAVAVNPSLKNVKDRTTALKLIKVQKRRTESEAFAMIESEFEMDQILLGDSAEILRQLPKEIFDVCLTDPPWSIYAKGEKADATLVIEQKELLPIMTEIYRVMKNDSFLYMVVSSPDLIFYHNELPKLGFRVQKHALIWHKPNRAITNFGRQQWEYSRDYEPIILAVKGSPVLTSVVEPSAVLAFNGVHYTKKVHPNEKPIELIAALLTHCSYEGNSVLDPFAGSGVTLEAAKKMNRHYLGIEKEKKFYDQIVRRLS